MRVTIYPTDSEVLDATIQRAMKTLRTENIFLHGGGIVKHDHTAVGIILLRHQTDHQRTVEVLTKIGIKAA